MADNKQDHYKTLGISKTATDEEITKACKELSMKYHPDRNRSEEATGKMAAINEAKDVLLDKDKRKKYDYFQQFGGKDNIPSGFQPQPGMNFNFQSRPGMNFGFEHQPGMNYGFGHHPGMNFGFPPQAGMNFGFDGQPNMTFGYGARPNMPPVSNAQAGPSTSAGMPPPPTQVPPMFPQGARGPFFSGVDPAELAALEEERRQFQRDLLRAQRQEQQEAIRRMQGSYSRFGVARAMPGYGFEMPAMSSYGMPQLGAHARVYRPRPMGLPFAYTNVRPARRRSRMDELNSDELDDLDAFGDLNLGNDF